MESDRSRMLCGRCTRAVIIEGGVRTEDDDQADQNFDRLLHLASSGGFSSNPADL